MQAIKSSLAASTVLLLFVMVPTCARSQECYTRIYPDNQEYVEATVDTNGLERNVVLADVQVEVTFNVAGRRHTSKWDFTDAGNRYLKNNEVYRRYFRVPEDVGSPARIVVGRFGFVREVTGATAQAFPERKREEKENNSGSPPPATRTIGEQP